MCKRGLLILMVFFKLSSGASERGISADSPYKSSDSCIVFVTTQAVKVEGGRQFFGSALEKDGRLRFYNINGAEQRIASRSSEHLQRLVSLTFFKHQ